MRYATLALSLLLLSNIAFAFQDSDIDGISDKNDLCPNTPFDGLVDKNGCSVNQKKSNNKSSKYWGEVTLKVGSTLRTDKDYDDENYLNLYANYRYHNWDVSISNTQLTTKNSNTEDNSDSDNDIYLSTGYTFALPSSRLKVSAGTKIVDDSTSTNIVESRLQGTGRFSQTPNNTTTTTTSRDNDYFASVNYNYRISPTDDLFGYYGYTLSGDSTDIDYEDYSSFSLGAGHAFNSSFYSALSYNYTGSIYTNGEAAEGITWFNNYQFNKKLFATASYSYGLDDYSYENAFTLELGFHFQ